jgi:hypothetical protein
MFHEINQTTLATHKADKSQQKCVLDLVLNFFLIKIQNFQICKYVITFDFQELFLARKDSFKHSKTTLNVVL